MGALQQYFMRVNYRRARIECRLGSHSPFSATLCWRERGGGDIQNKLGLLGGECGRTPASHILRYEERSLGPPHGLNNTMTHH